MARPGTTSSKVTEILLIRHGETAWNVEEIFRGTADIELNQNGVEQAELLAKYLSHHPIEAIYSSPLQRALKTAQIIARHYRIEPIVKTGLIDMEFGAWQGLTVAAVKEKYPDLFNLWAEHPENVRFPGGENLDTVTGRALKVIREIIDRIKGTAVLVSHRVVNKVLICTLLGLDNSHFWNIKQDNCGITTFVYEKGRFTLTGHNDTSFLRKNGAPGDF